MRKRVVQKGNIRREDYMRAVVTDTTPEEVPWIFSNDGFYANRSRGGVAHPGAKEFIEALVSPNKPYTIPYRYSVVRDGLSARCLSLIHPAAQESVARFYSKYDTLICDHVRKSTVSLRSPQKVGSTFFVRGPGGLASGYRRTEVDTVDIEHSVSNPASYFSYSRFSRAHQFFDSNDYIHLEKKYQVFRTLDVSKCFGSIYTQYFVLGDL